jgi:hypothetical protein
MNDETSYDRKIEDVGNIVKLEHVNLGVPDQSLATIFYVSGLGLTRDPYLMTGVDNMWVNVGAAQFHLPTRQPQKLRGHVGLVVPERESLLARLRAVRESLAGSQFDVDEFESHVEATCPWAIASDATSPTPRDSARSHWECPTSSSMFRQTAPEPSRTSIARSSPLRRV